MNTLTEIVQSMGNCVNAFGSDSARKLEVSTAFGRQHRTIQQLIVKLIIIPILQHLAECNNLHIHDARNQASCALAAKMLAAVTEDDLYLPLI